MSEVLSSLASQLGMASDEISRRYVRLVEESAPDGSTQSQCDSLAGAAGLLESALEAHRSEGASNHERLLRADLGLTLAAGLTVQLRRPPIEALLAEAVMEAALQLAEATLTNASVRAIMEPAAAASAALLPPDGALDSAQQPEMSLHQRSGIAGQLETALQAAVAADAECLRTPISALLGAGGKRIRPQLTLACARLGPRPDPDRSMHLAVAMELIHSATLVHDDIVDGNPTRRGQPTVARRHGPRLAVALGDYYFAKAARILAEMGVNEVTATVLDGVTRVCRAQLLEMESRGSIPTEAVYVEVATGKTAALLASGCVAGAQLSRATPEVVDAIRGFGERIGLAFQMIDDLVDLEPDGTGKPVGQDIRGGVASLPVIYALREKTWAGELESLLGEPDGVDRALDLVRRSGAVDAVRGRAASLAAEALGQLERIPDSRPRRDLEAIAQLAVQRRA